MGAFDWSKVQTAEELITSRSFRFDVNFRPILLEYMGIRAGMNILEVGCGPGTLAPYLGAGVYPGRVTGLDLDEQFIDLARQRANQDQCRTVDYVLGDAYDLAFDDSEFDATTSYAGIGVLSDPEKAVSEMIRVTRIGGSVSIMEPVTGIDGILFEGLDSVPSQDTFEGAADYHEMALRLRRTLGQHTRLFSSEKWPVRSFGALLKYLGLKEITINAWGYCGSPHDPEATAKRAMWLKRLLTEDEETVLKITSLSKQEVLKFLALNGRRTEWQKHHDAFSWEAGISIVFTGIK